MAYFASYEFSKRNATFFLVGGSIFLEMKIFTIYDIRDIRVVPEKISEI